MIVYTSNKDLTGIFVPHQPMPRYSTQQKNFFPSAAAGEWSLTFDAANLTAGLVYRLCIDVASWIW